MPERIQLRRTKGWRQPPNTVKVDRTTEWGNPFRISNVGSHDANGKPVIKPWWVEMKGGDKVWRFATKSEALDASVKLFGHAMTDRMKDRVRLALRGKNLACWCRPGNPCHADVLLEIANAE